MITKDEILLYHGSGRILLSGEDFIYLLPHPALRAWISNYTITFPGENAMPDHYTVIPHGSATLTFCADEKGICSNLFGPASLSCRVGEQANRFGMLFIIEFQPAGLSALTGGGQKELLDKTFSFALMDQGLNKSMTEILESSVSIQELADRADRLFLSKLIHVCPPQLHAAVRSIIENAGNITLKELSASVFYSERHLNRVFDRYLGMGVKTFSRLVRINSAIRLLHNPQNSITNASNLSGFYDLPHFIHDFKSICGISPQEYRREMSDFYSEIAKF